VNEYILYPALDLKDGQCVRLTRGDYNAMTVYNSEPPAVAAEFADAGAKWLHVVDLDAAREGDPSQLDQPVRDNRDVIAQIVGRVSIPIQVGGGIRTMQRLERLFEAGVSRCILGTAAVSNPAFVTEALRNYGERIAIGVDAKDGMVAVHGWTETSDVSATELGKRLAAAGATRVIFTDIARDGMLGGPNVQAIVRMAQETGLAVIASGGVRSAENLVELARHRSEGVAGAIIGKALYTGHVNLREAIDAVLTATNTTV